MPSEQMAQICTMHLMKVLLNNFTQNTNKDADMNAQLSDVNVNFTSQEIKIPAIHLFSELGAHINSELKSRITNK
jgi:hypothetical protein